MIIFFSDYFIRAHFRPLMSVRSRCSCEVEKCSMILVKISKSLRHLFNICLSAETIENTNEIYPVTFDGLGRRGVGKRKGHQVKGNFRFLNIQKSANPLSGTVSIQNHSPE